MNYNGTNSYSSTNYHSVDRDTARTLINDIMYKPSADEVAAIERHEAAHRAAKAAKAARKAEKAEQVRQARQARKDYKNASSYNAAAAYGPRSFGGASAYGAASYSTGAPSAADAYTYRPSAAIVDDKASIFSDRSSRSYNSIRSLLSRKGHGKAER